MTKFTVFSASFSMGFILTIIVLVLNALNDKPSEKVLIAAVAVSLVSSLLSISLYPPVQPYDEDNDFRQELTSEIHPVRKLSKIMNVGTFVTSFMAATRYTSV